MLKKDMIADFMELTQLEVYSRQERRIADVLIKKLEALGMEVTEDETGRVIGGNTGNLFAVLKGDPSIPPILFSSHMDRVGNNGHISPRWNKEEGIIYADGKTILAADDVSGLCCILYALRTVVAEKIPHGDIEVCFSCCEEVGVTGSRHYDFSQFKSKMAFVFDIPGRVGRIVTQAPGKGKVTIKIHGRTAHAGNEPEKGLNALRIAGDLLMQLPDGRQTPETTTNFAMISAGTATNVVCDLVTLIGEQRSTNPEEYKEISQKIRDAAAAVAEKHQTVIDVDILDQYATFHVPEEADCCRIAVKACQNIGVEPFFARGGGGMDGNHFNAHGIETIGIAPGYSKNHTPKEQLIVDDFMKCGDEAVEIIKVVASGDY